MRFTDGKTACPCYIAMRRTDGVDWIDPSTFASLSEESRRLADEFDRKYPTIAKDNKVVCIVAVDLTVALGF